MNDHVNSSGSTANSCEEDYLGYEIYVEENRDRYLDGFAWSVCKSENELDTGLAFSKDEALTEARKFVDSVCSTDKPSC